MANGGPPEGYHEVPAPSVSAGPPVGYHEVAAPTVASQPTTIQPEGLATRIGRGAALGTATGLGVPESQTPVRDLARGLNEQVNKAATVPWAQGGSLWGTLAMLGNMAKGAVKGEWESGKETYQGVQQRDPEMIAHGVTSGVVRPAAMFLGGKDVAEEGLPTGARSAVQEMVGEGPSKAGTLSDLHQHALAVKSHVQAAADAFHEEAQQGMSRVASAIDSQHPEGIFPKAEIQSSVKSAMGDVVKVPGKTPVSISAILEPKGEAASPVLFGKKLDLSDPAQVALADKLRSQGAIPSGPSDNWTFQQLSQLRSAVGRELGGLAGKGPVEAAANKVYGVLSSRLRTIADSHGLLGDWQKSSGMYKDWINDFGRSPLKRTLAGNNATDIMGPLVGKTAEQVKGILSKYENYGIDSGALSEEASRFGVGQNAVKAGKLSGWQMAASTLFPPYGAARVGVPLLMRQPEVLDAISGGGLKSISPSRVALKLAAKGGKTALAPTSLLALASGGSKR